MIGLSFLFAIAAGVVCAMRPLKAVDLHVYHAAAKSFFLQSGSMYGPNQEFAWPMLYRYPPLVSLHVPPIGLSSVRRCRGNLGCLNGAGAWAPDMVLVQ